ncbi:SAM-dependent methyltransferase [Actimicrobium sp. GrIS 1.19]|uniref:class I SAM-dependent methyltransferase n=1 Tax=Actimicrobium sp. GrIS 1.19 TaxID=3071708 RepID=UPI002E0C8CC3|nr:SAM-dependent methyltransferase [Actimicrobium sp. GrIS 1.19]
MDSTPTEKCIIALGPWLDSAAGAYLRAWEEQQFDALTADIFGFNAMQIGLPQINALRANRMANKWLADTSLPDGASRIPPVSVVHDLGELPYASQSMDLVVLPHVLEFSREPHQVLRDVERVLRPEGQLIICGFNPASLWGARQMLGRVSGSDFLPRDGEFISMPRLKDWLKLLNMEVSHGQFGCYVPPCRTDKWLQRFSFMEKAGARWWPYLGAVYTVQAIKRVKGMRLIGPVWRGQTANAPKAVPATNKIRRIK